MKPLLLHTRRFPPRRFHAITIFPFVFYNGKPLNDCDVQHETVHFWQQAALLVVPFYLLYVVFWVCGLFRYGDTMLAYRNIPFERSAYSLENTSGLSRTQMAFHWLSCFSQKKT